MILSIMGMYDYDDTLFEGFTVPGDLKEDCINNILIECAELEIIYPEYDILKKAITVWSNSNQISWQKIYNTMTVEYNPIWNVDATILEQQDSTGNSKTVLSHNDTDTESVKGFNSNNWSEARKNDRVLSGNDTKTDTLDNTINTRRTGNIGVTSTQSLIKEEREIAEFNFVNYITDLFKQRFCLMVY